MFFDSHAHLNDRKFSEDRLQILENLQKDALLGVINVGYDLKSSSDSVKYASQFDNVYAAVGFHPHDAKNMDIAALAAIGELAEKNEKVVAIGEIGLDYYYDHSPRDVQRECFVKQMELAVSLGKPVILHIRDAYGDALEILGNFKGRAKGVMHCFQGSIEVAKEVLSMGFYISFAGPVTFKNARKVKEVAAYIPTDRLLIETDCPYMAPEPYRGSRNEPKYVRFVAEEIAKLKGLKPEALALAAYENTRKLFDF